MSEKTIISIKDILKFNKTELIDYLGVEANTELSKIELQESAIEKITATVTEALPEQAGDALRKRTEEIIKQAIELDAAIETEDDYDNFIQSLDEQNDGLGAYARSIMPRSTTVATDLPLSQVIGNMPIRLVEQKIDEYVLNLPLGELINTKQVVNGITEILYKDFRPTGTKSGYSDVTISDFNGGNEFQFSDNYSVDTEISKSYDILMTALNNITLSAGLFAALVNDYTNAISNPIAITLFSRFVKFLGNDANYDGQYDFAGADAKAKAKELFLKLKSFEIPQRGTMKFTPKNMAAGHPGLLWDLKDAKTTLIINSKYAADYNFDLVANTFQMDGITKKYSNIKVIDFAVLEKEYGDVSTGKLTEKEIIVFENGVYTEMTWYNASKVTDTPKMKSVVNVYLNVGNFKHKRKGLFSFKNK